MQSIKKEDIGYFCPKCGKRYDKCKHKNSYLLVGRLGDQVIVIE